MSSGSVYNRDGYWWLDYRVAGKRIRESSKLTDKKAAKELLKQKVAGIRVPRSDVGFEDLVALITADYETNGRRSFSSLKCRIASLRAALGKLPARSITTQVVMTYASARLEQGAARGTVKLELAALRRMYTLAADMLDYAPRFPTIKLDNARTGFFEHDQYLAVLTHCPDWLRPVITFCYLTGWRIGEVRTREWKHIDFKRGEIRLEANETKNGKARIFPFGAMPELKRLLEERREGTHALEIERGTIIPWVFHIDGDPVRKDGAIRDAWTKACKAANLPGKLIHDFRRTAVRNLLHAGVQEKVAMTITGHQTRSIFDRYHIVDDRDQRDAVARLAEYHAR